MRLKKVNEIEKIPNYENDGLFNDLDTLLFKNFSSYISKI